MTDYLLDTNILLRIVQPAAPAHSVAVEAVASILAVGDNVLITAQNLIEFWSVATRPIEVNGLGWSAALVGSEIQQLQLQFPMLEDAPDIFTNWLQLVKQYDVQGKKVHDARLVAVMQTYQVNHLLTFNGVDFQRFTDITVIHPSDLIRKD